jgi:hypothetical protein
MMTIQTIEAILMPDGSIQLSEHVHAPTPRRVLVTILDEPAQVIKGNAPKTEHDRVAEALLAAGLTKPRSSHIPDGLLSSQERAALAQQFAQRGGKPLSQIVLEEREERC